MLSQLVTDMFATTASSWPCQECLMALTLLLASLLLLALMDYRRATAITNGCFMPPGPKRVVPLLGFLPFLDKEAPFLTLTKMTKIYGKVKWKL